MDGLFKSAIGGFRKADVLAYIEQLNAENQKASSELLSRIDELEGETHTLRDENAALRERIDSLDGLLEQEREGAKELGEKVVFLNSQINAQRDKLSRSDLEIHGLHSERDELQEMVRQYQEKLKGYEERQGEISGALVEAKRMAADLVRQGKRQGRDPYFPHRNSSASNSSSALHVLSGLSAMLLSRSGHTLPMRRTWSRS